MTVKLIAGEFQYKSNIRRADGGELGCLGRIANSVSNWIIKIGLYGGGGCCKSSLAKVHCLLRVAVVVLHPTLGVIIGKTVN